MTRHSPDVVSATNSRIRKKRRRRRTIRLSVFAVLFAIVIGGLSYLAHLPGLRIANVTFAGARVLSEDDMRNYVDERLSGSYLLLFPKNNIFLINKRHLTHKMLIAFPRMDTLDISMEKRVLHFSINEREAAYLWCGETPFPSDTTDVSCYYFDDTGFIFDHAPYFSRPVYFTLYDKATYGPSGLYEGGMVLHAKELPDLFAFVATLETLGVKGFALSISDIDEVTLYLGEEANPNATRVMWNLHDSYEEVGGNLKAALLAEPLRTDFGTDGANLSYIDLRYEGKVYYKPRQ